MHRETANLLSLGECDPELEKKIISDIERIVHMYINRNAGEIGSLTLSTQQPQIEKIALRALKNHLNGTIYQ